MIEKEILEDSIRSRCDLDCVSRIVALNATIAVLRSNRWYSVCLFGAFSLMSDGRLRVDSIATPDCGRRNCESKEGRRGQLDSPYHRLQRYSHNPDGWKETIRVKVRKEQ